MSDEGAPRQPLYNRLTLRMLASPARRLVPASIVGLRVTGRRSGRQLTFPVQAASWDERRVVRPGHPERKKWWHNIAAATPVDVLLDGRWRRATASLLRPGDADHEAAAVAYVARWPRAARVRVDPLVVLELGDEGPSTG